MPNEKQVAIAAKLYAARDTLRRLLGDEYRARIVTFVEDVSADGPDKILTRGMELAQEYGARANGMGMLYALAATVEALEPSEVEAAGR